MTALLVLSGFGMAAGILVAGRTLYRARGVPRTTLQFLSLAGAILCVSVSVTLLYAGWRMRAGTDSLRGKPVPAFRYRLSDGEHSTAEWRGKPVLLNLWATRCEPCRAELLMLSKLQTGVLVVALSDEDRKTVERFLGGGAYPGLQAGFIIEGAPKIPLRPVTMAIDAAGVVREVKLGALEAGEVNAMLAVLR